MASQQPGRVFMCRCAWGAWVILDADPMYDGPATRDGRVRSVLLASPDISMVFCKHSNTGAMAALCCECCASVAGTECDCALGFGSPWCTVFLLDELLHHAADAPKSSDLALSKSCVLAATCWGAARPARKASRAASFTSAPTHAHTLLALAADDTIWIFLESPSSPPKWRARPVFAMVKTDLGKEEGGGGVGVG